VHSFLVGPERRPRRRGFIQQVGRFRATKTPTFRCSSVGWRGDFYQTSVNSVFTPANSGNADALIASPKFGVVLGPFARTEFFVNAAEGFHSNDARGATITESPRSGFADRAGGGLPYRGNGPRAACGRADGNSLDACGTILKLEVAHYSAGTAMAIRS
jgi:hypothetical protein